MYINIHIIIKNCIFTFNMLAEYVVNDDLYRSYAYKICKCHELKNDLVNDMYLKLDSILVKDPQKEVNNRFIYLMIRSIFLNDIKKNKEFTVDNFPEVEQEEDVILCERITMDEVLSEMRFFDREILLKTQEKSLRKIALEVDCSYGYVHNMKQKALVKLRNKWQERE
jgi:RNA polymerase sigma factor (sigma-70 family)